MATKKKKSAVKKATKKPATKKKAVKRNPLLKSPETRVEKDVLDRTLKGVNKLLKAAGKPTLKALPDGIPEDSCECPIAIALRPIGVTSVSDSSILVEAKTTKVVESEFTPITKQEDEVEEEEIELYDADLPSELREAMDPFDDFVRQFDKNELDTAAKKKRRDELRDQIDDLQSELDDIEADLDDDDYGW